MIKIFRWLFGYVEFYFKNGFKEDFLSECFKEGIELRQVKTSGDYITAVCKSSSYKKLHKIAFNNGGVTRVIAKKGLPFILLPLKNRYGFFVGIVCFCVIISFLNAFIWKVEIIGNDRVSNTAITAYLENNNFKQGVMWSSVDREKLAWSMMSDFDDLAWVHINKIGTTARVEVNETVQAPTGDSDKLEGRDIFRKELTVTVNRQQADITLKDMKTYYDINFFSLNIPLYFNKTSGDVSRESQKTITVKGTQLPIGYTEYEEVFYSYTSKELDDDELKTLAKKRMEYLEQSEFEGFEIVNKTESYQLDETKCTAEFSYIIRRVG